MEEDEHTDILLRRSKRYSIQDNGLRHGLPTRSLRNGYMAEPFSTYTELSNHQRETKCCPACGRDSTVSSYMLCDEHQSLWETTVLDLPKFALTSEAFLEFVNAIRCPEPVLADSDWIAND